MGRVDVDGLVDLRLIRFWRIWRHRPRLHRILLHHLEELLRVLRIQHLFSFLHLKFFWILDNLSLLVQLALREQDVSFVNFSHFRFLRAIFAHELIL